MAKFCSFLWLSSIPCHSIYVVYVICHNFFIHPSIGRYLGCFHILAIVNNAAVSIGVHVSFLISGFVVGGYVPRTGIAGSCGISVFNFFEKIPYRSPPQLHQFSSPPTVSEGPLSPHPQWHLLFVFFLVIAFLTRVRWHLMAVLIDSWYQILLTRLVATHILSLEKGLFSSSVPF